MTHRPIACSADDAAQLYFTKHWWEQEINITRCSAEHIARAALRVLPPSKCYRLVNASPVNYDHWVGQNCDPIFRHLWTEAHRSMLADAGEIVVCNAISDCRYLVPFLRYSRSKCEVVRNRAKKASFSAPFFWRGPPIFGPSF